MDHATHIDIEYPLLPQGSLHRRDGSGALAQSYADQEPGLLSDVDGQAGFGARSTAPAFETGKCHVHMLCNDTRVRPYYVAPGVWRMIMRGLVYTRCHREHVATTEAAERQRIYVCVAVDVAKSLLHSATSWITTDVGPEQGTSGTTRPLLRSAGVSAFQLPPDTLEDSMVPADSQGALSEAPEGQLHRNPSSAAEPVPEGSQSLLGAVQPSLQRNTSGVALMQSRKESTAVSLDQVLSEPQPTGFAAAIETVWPLQLLLTPTSSLYRTQR